MQKVTSDAWGTIVSLLSLAKSSWCLFHAWWKEMEIDGCYLLSAVLSGDHAD